MIIQVGHSRSSDFIEELYNPIKNASFYHDHTWIFPHDGEEIDSRKSLKAVDLFIAEVSYPATGLGIEIGLASAYEKKILCISKKGAHISSSLSSLTDDFIDYTNPEDMITQISDYLKGRSCQKN